MAKFESEDGLAESTHEESVVEVDDLEFDELEVEPIGHRTAPPPLASDKLRQLLAKSRSVAGGLHEESEDDDYDEDATDVASPDVVSAAIDRLEGVQVAQPKFPVANLSGAMPGVQQSGAMPGVQQSGAMPGFQQSGAMPGVQQSGAMPGVQQSGAMPGLQQSGAMPGFQQSGAIPAVQQSGMYPAPGVQQAPLTPSGEFGMIPDIGSQSQETPRAAAPRSRTERSAMALGATVVVGVIAFLIIAKLVIDQWVTPSRAVIWMAAGTTLPTLLVGLLLSWPNREGGGLRDVIIGLAPALAISVAAVALATSWSSGTIRAQAVAFVPEEPNLMVSILEDPSEKVALEGCKRFAVKHEQSDWRTLLFATLTVRPELATKCMAELPEDTQIAIATSLLDRWSRELAVDEENPDEARLCATAGGVASLPLDQTSVGARLLECALGAPNATAQGCCGASLAATVVDPKQWAGRLRETIGLVRGGRAAPGVFAMAFHQQNLTEEQKNFAEKVNFTSPEAQLAALEFACAAVDADQLDVAMHMRAAIDGKCEVDAGKIPTSRAVWSEVCFLTLAEIEADKTRPPAATLCQMTRDVVVNQAIDTARRLVYLGARKDVKSALADKIDYGYLEVVNSLSTKDGLTAETPSYVTKEDADRARQKVTLGPNEIGDNFQYAMPGDDDFKAFVRAYQANKKKKDK